MIEVDSYDFAVLVERGDAITIFTKKKNILKMEVTEVNETSIKGHVTVIDRKKIPAKIHEIRLADITKIKLGANKRTYKSTDCWLYRELESPWCEITIGVLYLYGFSLLF